MSTADLGKSNRCLLLPLLLLSGTEAGVEPDWTWQMPTLTKDGRTTDAGPNLSFDYKVTSLILPEQAWQDLAFICQKPETKEGNFWVPSNAQPRSLTESIALAVFRYHTVGAIFDPETSGAEWWAQVRYGGRPDEGVPFHWDKDEAFLLGSKKRGQEAPLIHPHLGTVTYVTDDGAPTLLVEVRNNSFWPTDDNQEKPPATPVSHQLNTSGTRTTCCPPLHECAAAPSTGRQARGWGPFRSGFVSRPEHTKHIAFDGQLFHGSLPRPGEPEEVRISFLVNLWLNHRPMNSHRLEAERAHEFGAVTNVGFGEVLAPLYLRADAGDHLQLRLPPYGALLKVTLPPEVDEPGISAFLEFPEGHGSFEPLPS